MDRAEIIGAGLLIVSAAALGWMWWAFQNAPLVDDDDDDDEDYGSWNDER